MLVDLLAGRRREGLSVNLAAAGVANAVNILVLSTFAAMVGTKTFVIKRFKVRNNGCGNTFVHLGTGAGAGFVDLCPPLWSINDTTDDYPEFDLPQTEVQATITSYPDVVGAGTFDVMVEVEERG